jgi:hypothetical protein
MQTYHKENTMNRRSILTISAMMVLGLALLPGSALAQQKPLKDQVSGVWTLVSLEQAAPNGTNKREPLGANPRGILILDTGGRYALVLTKADAQKFKSGNRLEATTEEYAAWAQGTAAQFGSWSIDETNKTLVQQVEGALNPNNGGSEKKATVSLVGNELKVTDPTTATGESRVTVYRRAK